MPDCLLGVLARTFIAFDAAASVPFCVAELFTSVLLPTFVRSGVERALDFDNPNEMLSFRYTPQQDYSSLFLDIRLQNIQLTAHQACTETIRNAINSVLISDLQNWPC
jgi:hypothetical protein